MHMLRRPSLILWCLWLASCIAETKSTSSTLDEATPKSMSSSAAAQPSMASMQPPPPEPASVTPAENPYAGAAQWCEPMLYDTPCETDRDCADIDHVSLRPLRCVVTRRSRKNGLQNAEGEPQRFCARRPTSRLEYAWRRARLREAVARTYFDEAEHCPAWTWELTHRGRRPEYRLVWANEKPLHKQHWRCQREWSATEHLTGYLWAVYEREVGGQPWRRHRLNPDETANKTAWVKEAKDYGWQVELVCANGRRKCKKRDMEIVRYEPDPEAAAYNPYYGERHRWQYGLGPYGKNTAYGAQDWDLLAPPEILCLEIPGTEAYLRDARHAVKVLRGSGVECSGEIYKGRAVRRVEHPNGVFEDVVVQEPSWLDVHRVASAGKYCPQNKESKTRGRLRDEGVNPDQPVTLDMLGRAIPRGTQNEYATAALHQLDATLPPPFDDPA